MKAENSKKTIDDYFRTILSEPDPCASVATVETAKGILDKMSGVINIAPIVAANDGVVSISWKNKDILISVEISSSGETDWFCGEPPSTINSLKDFIKNIEGGQPLPIPEDMELPLETALVSLENREPISTNEWAAGIAKWICQPDEKQKTLDFFKFLEKNKEDVRKLPTWLKEAYGVSTSSSDSIDELYSKLIEHVESPNPDVDKINQLHKEIDEKEHENSELNILSDKITHGVLMKEAETVMQNAERIVLLYELIDVVKSAQLMLLINECNGSVIEDGGDNFEEKVRSAMDKLVKKGYVK